LHRASLRFSLTKLNTAEELEETLNIIPTAVSRLRELAPVNAGTLGQTGRR
jgi:cysteine desulfurase